MSFLVNLTIRGGAALASLAAAWLIAGAWLLPGTYPPPAKWDDLAVGIVVLGIMGMKVLFPSMRGPGWLAIALGLWVMFAPWVLGYAQHEIALRNDVATAIGLIIAASIAVLATLTAEGAPSFGTAAPRT